MRLGLSSAVAPEATLDELLAACARRGLAALELRAGDAHGVTGGLDGVDGVTASERATAAGVAISGFRSGDAASDVAVAAAAVSADAPVIVAGGAAPARFRRALNLLDNGVSAALVLEGDGSPDEIARAAAAGLDLAWDFVPGAASAPHVEEVLRLAGDRLRYVRVVGGGPEAAIQEGQGIGPLMRSLALGGYAGTLVLAPSSPRYRVAWRSWLGRRGGWGCGSKADRSFVRLGAERTPATGGAR